MDLKTLISKCLVALISAGAIYVLTWVWRENAACIALFLLYLGLVYVIAFGSWAHKRWRGTRFCAKARVDAATRFRKIIDRSYRTVCLFVYISFFGIVAGIIFKEEIPSLVAGEFVGTYLELQGPGPAKRSAVPASVSEPRTTNLTQLKADGSYLAFVGADRVIFYESFGFLRTVAQRLISPVWYVLWCGLLLWVVLLGGIFMASLVGEGAFGLER